MEHAHLAFTLAVQRALSGSGFEAICWSPYSVACALGLAATGARGTTRTELVALLHGETSFAHNEGSDANDSDGTHFGSGTSSDGNGSAAPTKHSAMSGGVGDRIRRSATPGGSGDRIRHSVVAGGSGDLDEHSAMLGEAGVLDSGPAARGADGPVLGVANTLWAREDIQIRPEFTAELGRWPSGRVRTAPFNGQPEAARRLINADVAETTRGLIPELLGAGTITAATVATLVNALYLKVAWRNAFPKHATEPRPFHTSAGPVQVPTMRLPNKRLGYAAVDGWQVVVLPAAGEVEAVILLPDNTSASPTWTGVDGPTAAKAEAEGKPKADAALRHETARPAGTARATESARAPGTARAAEAAQAAGTVRAVDAARAAGTAREAEAARVVDAARAAGTAREAEAARAAEVALDADTLAGLLAAPTPRALDLYLPRFAVRARANLTSALAALGARTMFSDQADFSGIADRPMPLAGVRHEAVLTVDEQGLEGAAATGMVMRALALRRDVTEPLVVRVDRPFLFLVRHHTSGAIYFLARVTRP